MSEFLLCCTLLFAALLEPVLRGLESNKRDSLYNKNLIELAYLVLRLGP